jgi:hypothetical protein
MNMANADTYDDLFRVAVAALDAGDIGALERLIAAHPTILSARLESPGPSLRERVGAALNGFFNRTIPALVRGRRSRSDWPPWRITRLECACPS